MRCLSIVTATMRTRSKNATCRSSVGRKRKSNTIFDEGEVHKKAKNIRQVRGHKKTGAIGKSCKNLVQAVSCNDLKCICDILKKTKHIKKTCKADLKAAILKAIENGKLKILQHVVLHAGKLDVTFWSRSIRLAVQHGQVDILEYLLEHNTNTSDVEKAFMLSDEKGNTALHLCQQNDTAANHMTRLILKAVQLLAKITRSRCIDAQNKLGETALIKAVKNMRLENVVQLHLAGADTSVKDKHGNTAVSLAQELEISYLFEKRYSRISESPIVFDDAEDLQFYLVSKRENPDYEFGISKDILLEEMFNDKWDKLKDPLPGHDTCKVCQERKRNKRNATYCTKHMYTLLPFTCKEKEKVDLLIKAGADSLRSGRLGPWNIPLLMAVHQGDTDLVNLMLINQRQHDVDASIYASALKISVKCNYSEIFNILLPFLKENMSNIKEQNICQEILETAVDLGYENYLTRLLDVVKNIDLFRLLTIAVKRGNLPMFAKFQKMKCSFFKVIKSSQGTDLLIIACSVNSHLMVSRLLNLGVNTMYKDSSSLSHGISPKGLWRPSNTPRRTLRILRKEIFKSSSVSDEYRYMRDDSFGTPSPILPDFPGIYARASCSLRGSPSFSIFCLRSPSAPSSSETCTNDSAIREGGDVHIASKMDASSTKLCRRSSSGKTMVPDGVFVQIVKSERVKYR